MKPRDLIRLTLSNLRRTRGRAIMTAMGVLIGTAAIVVLIALAAGLQENALSSFSDFGALNQITVMPGAFIQAFGPGGGETAFSEDALLTPDVLREFEDLPGVIAVTPVEGVFASTTLRFNRMVGTAGITGIDPRAVEAMGIEVADGSSRLGNWTAVIGSRVAENFVDQRRGSRRDPEEELDLYGQTLTLEVERVSMEGETETRTMRVRVGGVMEERGGQDDNTIYLALEDVEELNTWVSSQRPDRRRDGYNNAIIIVDESEQALEVEGTLLDMGFYAFSARTIIQQVSVFFVIIQAVFGGIGAIALLVAAIGITNTMIMSIMERTREIGLMKAVGATNRDVMSIFLTEAGLIGVMGGIGGVVFGAVVSKVIDVIAAAYINAQTAAAGSTPSDPITIVSIPLWLPIFAVLFSLVIGLGSGIYPALRAVQLDPVTALKYE